MAFSQTIDPTVPTGADDIRDGDNRMRNLAQATLERLVSLVVAVDSDPLRLNTTARHVVALPATPTATPTGIFTPPNPGVSLVAIYNTSNTGTQSTGLALCIHNGTVFTVVTLYALNLTFDAGPGSVVRVTHALGSNTDYAASLTKLTA